MTSELDKLMAVMEVSFDPHFREAWTYRQVEESLMLPSTFMLLIDGHGDAPHDDAPAAGFILARQAVDEIELLLIAVRPDFRGKGLGKQLLERFIDTARQRDAAKVFLEMRANNPAERLYRAAGFEQIGQRHDYYRTVTGTTIDALTFARAV